MTYAFNSITAWTPYYNSCVIKWAQESCPKFFIKFAPDLIDLCNATLANAQSKLAGLFDFFYPTYSYPQYDNRAIGLRLSMDVCTSFNWVMPAICERAPDNTFNECMRDGLNLTQELSCNHAIYANNANQSSPNIFNYLVPMMTTAFLLYSNLPSLTSAKPTTESHKQHRARLRN